jgi:hypothetical protein
MARNNIALFAICALVIFVGRIDSLAQESCIVYGSCSISSLYAPLSNCAPELAATAYSCQTTSPWTAVCKVKSNACAPPSECPSCNRAAHPIDLATGNTDISQTDIRIPGLGGGLTLVRTWNGVWPPIETSSRAGGVDAVTISYPQPPPAVASTN